MNILRDFVQPLAVAILVFATTLVQAQAPTITVVRPSTGGIAGEVGVTIDGTNLSAVTSVTFGGVGSSIIRKTATSVTVAAPPHAVGAVDVVVISPGPLTATATNGFTFVNNDSAARDFSIWTNPTSRWLYGKAAAPGYVVSNYGGPTLIIGNDHWSYGGGAAPMLWHNGTSAAITESTLVTPSMALGLLPGPAPTNEYSVVQWKAPASGTYTVAGSFYSLDAASTDVHIIKNGSSVVAGGTVTLSLPVSFSSQVTLAAGGTIDFAVGNGGNGNANDATGLDVVITQVPTAANVVTNTNDSGAGSLRAALTYFTSSFCDTSISPPIIEFLIPGPGPHTVSPASALPTLNCAIQLDGYTQAGASLNTGSGGSSNANIKIILNGSSCAGCDGVVSSGSGASIQGLSIHSFPGAGIRVTDGYAYIDGNYIGTDPGGETDLGNGNWGVRIEGGDGYIGDFGYPETRNLITGNSQGGIFVGTGGTCAVTAPSEPTRTPKGLKVVGAGADIHNNQIGGTRGGGSAVFNSGPGVYLSDPGACGASLLMKENHIRFNNPGAGVVLASGQRLHLYHDSTYQGSIYGNSKTAFDLGDDWLSGNANIAGANGGVKTPQITGVAYNHPTCSSQPCVLVTAQVPADATRANYPVRLDFFHNDSSPAVPEGKAYIGSISGLVSGASAVTLVKEITGAGSASQNITATATYATCSSVECPPVATSEYSFPMPAPVISLSPSSLSFGSVAVGTTSTMLLTVTNSGNAPLNIGSVLTSGHADFTASGCAATAIPPAGTCTVTGSFTPTSVGVRSSTLTIASDATGSPHSLSMSGTGASPTASFSSTSLTFGNVNVGTSASQTVTITNTGGATLILGPISPPGSTAFSASGCSGAFLAPGSSCPITVTFTPSSTALITSTFGITSNAAGSPHTVSLSGTGAAPAVSLAVPSTFGNVPVGSTATISGTLTNSGNAALNITSLATSGGAFGVGTCPSSLAAGATCTFPLTFAPTAPGAQSGQLTLVSNAAGSPHTASLAGNGTQPGVSFSPSPASFGSVEVNAVSTASITLTNPGAAPLAISALTVTGTYFSRVSTTCPISPATLASTASCTVLAAYSPTATGPHSGQLTLSSNAPGNPHTVALSGTGTAPGVSLTPSPVIFGNVPVGGSAGATLNLTNTGTATLSISSIVTTGTFFSNTTTCGATLAPGASCPIVATYAPGAAGAHSGQVSVTTNAGAGPVVAPLSGTGAVPVLSLSSASVDFGSQTVGSASLTQPVTITNTGGAPLNLSAIAASGDFNFTGCPTPLSLAPGASCMLSIKFVPTAVGTRSGGISIGSNASGTPHAIALTGNGTPVPVPGIALAPGSASFGAIVTGTNSTQVLVLSNPGTAPLAISSIGTTGAGFSQTNTCPASLEPSAACNISVKFAPTVEGAASGQLAIVSNAAPSPLNAALSGSGLPATTAGLTFSAGSVAFPPQFVGTTSAPQTVTLTSAGTAPLVITQVTSSGDFSYSGCGPSTMAPRATCSFSISFKPFSEGPQSGAIVVTSNAAGSPHTISLSGSGASLAAPEIVVAPSSFVFGTLRPLRTATLRGRLNNTGAAPLTISQVSTTGAMFSQTNTCVGTIAVGDFCELAVTYAPTATGPHSGQLVIHSNAIPSPHIAALSGTGVAVPPPFLTADGPVSFGQQVSGTTTRRTLTLSNTGGDPLLISSMAIIGSAAFGVQGGCTSIAPEASCPLTVTFIPTGLGPFSARLDIVSNHSGGVVQVQLAGTGVALPAPDLDFSVGALGFGNQGLNTSAQPARSVRLTNIGGAPVTIGALRVTLPDFRIPAGACVGTMAPGAFCDVEVMFHPVAPGPRQASLVVDSTPAQNDSVALIGVGCRQILLGRNQSPARLCSP